MLMPMCWWFGIQGGLKKTHNSSHQLSRLTYTNINLGQKKNSTVKEEATIRLNLSPCARCCRAVGGSTSGGGSSSTAPVQPGQGNVDATCCGTQSSGDTMLFPFHCFIQHMFGFTNQITGSDSYQTSFLSACSNKPIRDWGDTMSPLYPNSLLA